MTNKEDKEKIEELLKETFKSDRAKTQIEIEISELNLIDRDDNDDEDEEKVF